MTFRLESHLGPDSRRDALRADVLAGLTARPRTLPPKWFYDEAGSALFDEITRLPEYYPTRAERAILDAHAGDIAAATRAETLVELGSGTSEKTRLLLDALTAAGTLRRFVPFDVDASVLADAGAAVLREYPGLEVHAVAGDFEHHLPLVPHDGRTLFAFLGSTIGNLAPAERAGFLEAVRGQLAPGDALLLGADLVKEVGTVLAAYDDVGGVTGSFNRNVLLVVNRELKADFDPAAFDHVAHWDPEAEWIEMRLRSVRDQRVWIADLDLEVVFGAGEELRTEISAKFRREGLTAELAAAGLEVTHWWTDPAGDFSLSLSVPLPS